MNEEQMKIDLTGRIDSNNAGDLEEDINNLIEGKEDISLIFDAKDLEYISSAGLRVLLRIRKHHPDIRVINVNSEVYEIFEMTGFTEIMPVDKAYRIVSVEGCEEIGRGANGTIYRIDKDNVVKVYNNADALEDIKHEREVARTALVLGIPTAISYDVVKVGDSYGSVFELLNAQSFSKILANEPDKIDWCVKEFTDMLKKIHGTLVPEGKLPDVREAAISWTEYLKDILPEELHKKLVALIGAVPHDDHMIHGDYHTKNLEMQNDEVLLIDMDTLAVGHPIFEFASMYNAFAGFSEIDQRSQKDFLGFDYEFSVEFWHRVLAAYLNTDDDARVKEVEDKARIIGYTRMIRRSLRRKLTETEQGRAEVEHWTNELRDLLEKTDTLLF